MTPGFAPFEQYGQKPADARTDVYAFGATLYAALTGQTPLESIDLMGGALLPAPRSLNPSITPQIESAVLKAMALLPDQRFQSVMEFKAELTAFNNQRTAFSDRKLTPAQDTVGTIGVEQRDQLLSLPKQTISPVTPPPAVAPALARESGKRAAALDAAYVPLPEKHRLPWAWIVVGVGALALIVIGMMAVVAGFLLRPTPTPTTDVRALQTALALQWTRTPTVTIIPTRTPTRSPTLIPTHTPTSTPTKVMLSGLPVGIVLPSKDEPRWIQDEARFKDAFTNAGYNVQILFSQGDSATEKANVEALVAQGINVLIICPQDGAAAASAVEEARTAGVIVISYDRLVRDTDAVDYYVSFDSIAVGEAQAQYLVDKSTGTGNPLYLYTGAASDNNAFLFFEGAWNVLQPKIADGTFVIKNSSEAVALQGKARLTRNELARIINQVTTQWDFYIAQNLAESNLSVNKAADKGDVFILAPNDGTARAIADVFAADNDVTSYVITGQDAEKASIQYIIDGKQSMTVLKDVRTLVQDAIKAAIAYLEGKTPPQTTTYNNGAIDVPADPSVIITVDRSNVKAVVIDSGYWPASDFTGLP